MQLKNLSDQELETSFHHAVKSERKIMHAVILHIQEVERRKLYLAQGKSSLLTYLVKVMKYSESSAQRRIAAAKLMTAVPRLGTKLEAGELNLTQCSEIQTAVRQAEKVHQSSITSEQKSDLVDKVLNLNTASTQQAVAEALNIPVLDHQSIKTQKDKSKRIEVTFTEEQFKKYEQVRDRLAHKNFQKKHTQSIADVLETAFDELLKLKMPKAQPSKVSEEFRSDGSEAITIDALKLTPEHEGGGKMGKALDGNSEANKTTGSKTSHDELKPSAKMTTRKTGTVASCGTDGVMTLKSGAVATCGSNADRLTREELEAFGIDVDNLNPSRDPSRDREDRNELPPKTWRSLTPKRKKMILEQDQCCQWENYETGEVCSSTFNLQIDHIQPKWAGGSNDPSNLRVLCRLHNLYRERHLHSCSH